MTRTIPWPDTVFDLGPTRTYSSRLVEWLAGSQTLLVTLRRFGKFGAEATEYGVDELDPLPGLIGRQFRLTQTGGRAEGPRQYTVVVGGLARCDCQAGQTRNPLRDDDCKHLAALRRLVELEDPTE